MEGYINLARQIIESEIWVNKPEKWLKIWLFLLLQANFKDNKQFKRGSFWTKYEIIQLNCNSTRAQVDMCIRWLKSMKMLTTQKTTRGFIISIVNYDKFQDNKYYKNDTENEIKTTQKRHRNDTIKKNDKNDNNTIVICDDEKQSNQINQSAKALIDYWFKKWVETFGRKPKVSGAKFMVQAKGVISTVDLEVAKKVCDVYFITDNEMYRKQGWGFMTMTSSEVFNSLLTKI